MIKNIFSISLKSYPSYHSYLCFFFGSHSLHSITMGNSRSRAERETLPVDTVFSLPSPLPPWPQGEGFASGSINLGDLEVCQISKFNKIWEVLEGGPDNLGAAFFEPLSVPDGYFMLGCYAQANNKPLSGWILAGKNTEADASREALKLPVDYALVWSSSSLNINKTGDGYIWLPMPSDGYSAVGLVVTNSPNKPPLDKVRCVRSDLVEPCELDAWVWGSKKESSKSDVNVYGLRPASRGTQALGVQVGTFYMQVVGAASTVSLSCLKNVNYNLSCMPNLPQIDAVFKAYSPKIYFHTDEEYFPSSTNWYFNQGVLLYHQGDEANPVIVEPNGANLPQGGSNDGTYWLDLPTDETVGEKVKKGDLQNSTVYLHVKPTLGATFTDMQMWIFYPFNGPASLKLQLANIPLGKIGEHIGDWEHVTLRISNFTGELSRVYLSQHSKGTWSSVSELEYGGGNTVVVYASQNGHAFYPKAGLVLQGNSTLDIGVRNETTKSKSVTETGVKYEVVAAGYLEVVVEPPWLNYMRKWGPKISYNFANELKAVENFIPGGIGLINILPNEILGEDGPAGPKAKNNWDGDEAI